METSKFLKSGRNSSIALFIIFLTMSLTSCCPVKEIRDACPCRVDLDLSRILARPETGPGSGREIGVAVYDRDGGKVYDRMFGTDTCAAVYEAELPRGHYTVSALSVREGSDAIPEMVGPGTGGVVDSLYGISTPVNATGEEAAVILEPFKQFATLSVRLLSAPAGADICLDAGSSAIERKSLLAAGEKYQLRTAYDGTTAGFRIPRQAGYDLSLSVIDISSGGLLAEIDLGGRLRDAGYDFSATNLADIVIIIDLGESTASIEVEGWKEALLFVIF